MDPQQLELAQAILTRRAAGAGPTAIVPPPASGLGGPFDALIRSPDLAARYRELAAWAFAVTTMPRDLIEFSILVMLRQWNAQYPFWAHVILGRQAGLSDEVMEAIRTGAEIPFSDSSQRIVHQFLVEYLTGNRVSTPTYVRLRDAIGEAGVVDLIGIMGSYAMTAMIANVFEVPIPDAPYDPALEPQRV